MVLKMVIIVMIMIMTIIIIITQFIYTPIEFDSLKLVQVFYSLTLNPLTWKIW
jgi:hypothetical protein